MSGKRKVWTGTEEQYRVQHEREMRVRFMQADISGITPPELQVEHIWRAQQSRCGQASAAAVNSMPLAQMSAMRPWAVEQRLEAVIPAAPVVTISTPALPPAWYQRAARDLVARLGKAGFAVRQYNPNQHTITLARADGSLVQIQRNASSSTFHDKSAMFTNQAVPVQSLPVEVIS